MLDFLRTLRKNNDKSFVGKVQVKEITIRRAALPVLSSFRKNSIFLQKVREECSRVRRNFSKYCVVQHGTACAPRG